MIAPLRTERLSVRLGDVEAVRDVSLAVREGALTAVVGPNGAGKSTLLSVLSGFRREYSGACELRGREMGEWGPLERAREVAFIPQNVGLEFAFSAEDVVYMGRTPHGRGLFANEADREAVERAIELAEIGWLRGRDYRVLSGGEKQRVVLASALAQETPILLLDEPTAHLDLRHQMETYALLARLAREGKTVVAVTHDLNLAVRYADRVAVLSCGELVADGTPSELLAGDVLGRVFQVGIAQHGAGRERPWLEFEIPGGREG